MQIPSFMGQYQQDKIPTNFLNFFLRFELSSSNHIFRNKGFETYHHIYFTPNGELEFSLNNYDGEKSIDGFVNFVVSIINNEDAWN